jgi:amino acid adenylation domain-containing protein
MRLRGETLPELFEVVAERFPDRVAVTAVDGEFSYRDLSRMSNAVAGELESVGVRPGTTVALLAPRTGELVTGILGILKAGAAYIPIDPDYPRARIEWMIKDSEASTIVSTSHLSDVIASQGTPVVMLDRLAGPSAEWANCHPPSGDDLAYVIYTSGSTGVPKGVQIDHRNVIRLFEVTQPQFCFDENDVWSVFHSAAFDFSVWEIWGGLLFGGRLVIVPLETARSPEAFHELLRIHQVSILNQTPSAFYRLAAADARSGERLSRVRVVVFGGERLESAALSNWIERHGDEYPRLANMYGITEATVHASYHPITAGDVTMRGVSRIGHPLPDLDFHVLDEDLAPVGTGLPGELYIAGAGLTRGYLGRPGLNKERFVGLPGPGGLEHRCYRTGDRVIALPEGGYGYLGRVDDQLKVRGHRVEPGEIEAFLLRHADVSAAVVVARDRGDGDVRIVAYVASPSEGTALAARLGEAVAAELPPYMRPSSYVVLPELPLTLNGKVDKNRLPVYGSVPDFTPSYVEPGADRDFTETEQRVGDIWRSVLDVTDVDRDVDFFDFGGTSLSLVRMLDRVNEAFGIKLDVTVLIDGATIGALACQVDNALSSGALTFGSHGEANGHSAGFYAK